jgi:urate oxidase
VGIILGANQYGKAEIRVVKIDRDTPRHDIHDLSVTTTLRGDFAAAHRSGNQANVLPTDSQKNTVFAFAKQYGVDQIEDFALDLARHFVETVPAVTSARVGIDAYAWDRVGVAPGEAGHDHAFVRRGQDIRTTAVTVGATEHGPGAWVVSGIKDLVVLKSTGSEFRGFFADRFTTLAETDDRILATRARRRLGRLPRRHPGRAAGHLRWHAQPRPSADPAGHGHGGAEGPSRGRGDPLRRAEQAPLRRRPGAVRAG